MAKYTNAAGFKAITAENAEEECERLPRLFVFLIIGGAAAVIIVIFLIVHTINASTQAAATSDEAETTAAITENYDYDELFGVRETTVPATQAVRPTITGTIPLPTPVPETQPPTVTAPARTNSNTPTQSPQPQVSHNETAAPQQSQSGNVNQPRQSGTAESRQSAQQAIPDNDNSSAAIPVSEMMLSYTNLSLTVGQTVRLSASLTPENATNKSVTWTSDNSSVASVNQGTVTGNKAGKATVYAVSSNGKRAGCTVTVSKKQSSASSISLSPGDTTIKRGQELTIRLNGAKNCTWSESNPFVVKMIVKGSDHYTVKGAKKGVTNIVATLSNGQSCKVKITVES